jgi:hypothetical protein
MEAGKIDVKRWITHRVCSANLVDVFPEWLKAGSNVLKAVVEW